MAKVISIINHKGGVAKTTSSHNIGYCLADKGYRVFMIDLEFQANLTYSLVKKRGVEKGIGWILTDERVIGVDDIHPTNHEKLKLIPADRQLRNIEIILQSKMRREEVLKNSLESIQESDFIIIDNPPGIGLPVVNSLTASDYALIPIFPDTHSAIGFTQVLETIETIQKKMNSNLAILGAFISKFDRRNKVDNEIADYMKGNFDFFMDEMIRVNTNFASAPSKAQSIFEYETESGKGRKDYLALCDALIERIK